MTDGSSVLGIDAAWTLSQPSGVALVHRDADRWRLVAVAPSYTDFCGTAGGQPDVRALVSKSADLCGREPDLIAIDMPLSHAPITSRRASDDAISRAYGSRHCSTHTPSSERPGGISDRLTAACALAGYPLAVGAPTGRGLIEVYPHPALVELTGAPRRLPYKAGKMRNYWPDLPPQKRRERLLEVWRDILVHLDQRIDGVAATLDLPDAAANGRTFKAFEDMLDAVICAWVGVCVLKGEATAYGNDLSAIWVPSDQTAHAG